MKRILYCLKLVLSEIYQDIKRWSKYTLVLMLILFNIFAPIQLLTPGISHAPTTSELLIVIMAWILEFSIVLICYKTYKKYEENPKYE